MAKIGRNEPCPCGSGAKFKKCCLLRKSEAESTAQPKPAPSLQNKVDAIRAAAADGETKVSQLGVFVLFAAAGDAWLLEISEMDALQLAVDGKEVEVSIEENPETIEVNWSHRFTVDKQRFSATPYTTGARIVRDDYPVRAINAAIKGIRKRLPANSGHIVQPTPAPA